MHSNNVIFFFVMMNNICERCLAHNTLEMFQTLLDIKIKQTILKVSKSNVNRILC